MKHVILALVFVALSCSSAQAEKFLIASGEWSPYTSERLEGYGMMAEIISAVFHEMGEEVEYRFYPWPRCLLLVTRGKAWAAFPYLKTEARLEKRILYSEPLGTTTMKLFYYDSSKDYSFESWKDLGQYALGGISGYFYEDAFEAEGLDVNYSVDTFSGLRKLRSGRIELLIEDELVGWQVIRENFPEDVQRFGTVEKAFHVGEVYAIFSKHLPGTEELLTQFNLSLQKIRENGIYDAIVQKYHKTFAVADER